MGETGVAARARSFERGATNYERVRPSFPDALFFDIAREAGDRLSGAVLEVGAGTGRATLPLARMGAHVQVIEPSTDMLDVLGQRLRDEDLTDKVTLRRARFEDVSKHDRYDVVVAAQSFHWTSPTSRWSRLAALLQPDGRAFLFWNGWQLDPSCCDVDAVADAYARHGNGLDSDLQDRRADISWVEDELRTESRISIIRTRTYGWPWQLATSDYLQLLMTTSQYAVADPTKRATLFDELQQVLGDQVDLAGRSVSVSLRSSL